MFSFLIFIGFSIIILGVYLEKPKEYNSSNDSKDMNEMMERILNIESAIYNKNNDYSTIEEEVDEEPYIEDYSFEEVMKETTKGTSIEEKNPFEIISLHENGKYSLEETCKILDMQKGEVLLLKNLYKESQK